MDFLRSLDWNSFFFVNSTLSHPWLDVFFPAITDLHKTLAFQILAPLFFGFLFCRLWRWRGLGLLVLLLICLGSADFLSSRVLKNTIERTRPFETPGVTAVQKSPAGGFSMPSNHSVNMFALATYSSQFLPASAPYFFAAAALIAYSRVYNGVHFPSDVIVGAVWGCLFGWFFSMLARRLLFRRKDAV